MSKSIHYHAISQRGAGTVVKPAPLNWLLDSRDPPIRYQALVDILHRPRDSKEVLATETMTLDYAPVRKVLKAQTPDGYWPPDDTCYHPKWTSTVWPLILLGEMGVPATESIKTACERFLNLHQMENGAFSCPSRNGRRKMVEEPCLTGNMIRTLIAFGYGDDRRVRKAIDWMPEHQQEDGGWNCDFPPRRVKHSSFMSSIEPLWAYSEIPRRKWTRSMKRSIERAAEFFLMHRLFKSDHHNWKPTEPEFTKLHFPMYYFYDALHGLRVLTRLGYGDDERMRDAVHLVLSKMSPVGTWTLEGDWHSEGDYMVPKGKRRNTLIDLEAIGEPSKWITLNCYRALTLTGDLNVPE